MGFLAKIDLSHAWIACDFLDTAFGEQRAPHEHGYSLSEVEDQIHIVLDEQYRDVVRQRGDTLEDVAAISGRNAGGRLVKKKNPGLAGYRHCDFEEALLAVGQVGTRDVEDVRHPERLQEIRD